MADIQHIKCKNQQNTSSNCQNIVSYEEIGVKCFCHNFNQKLTNDHFCAFIMKIWLKVATNAAKLPKFEAINRKLWLPRTIMVIDLIDLCPRSRLT